MLIRKISRLIAYFVACIVTKMTFLNDPVILLADIHQNFGTLGDIIGGIFTRQSTGVNP